MNLGGGAFPKVGVQPSRGAEDMEKLTDDLKLVGVRVAEDNHVIGIQGDARGHPTLSEAAQHSSPDAVLEEGVERVDDQREKHGRDGGTLSEAFFVADRGGPDCR